MKSMTLIFANKEIKSLVAVKNKLGLGWKRLFLYLANKEMKGGKDGKNKNKHL